MKKTAAIAIIVLAMLAPGANAQTFPAARQKTAAQSGEKSADTVTITADYALSGIGFSIKDFDSGSILTWRDIILNGAQINVEFNKAPFVFNKTNIGAGFHKSFHGYHTDDDATNGYNVIHVASTEAFLLDLKYEILLEENRFNPKLGMDFNYLRLENYNAVPYFLSPSNISQNMTGLANKSDVFKYCLYGGMQAKIVEKNFFYMNVSGQTGLGLYFILADWVLRSDFKHPVSFYNISLCFRTGGDLEMGFNLGMFTIFTKALLVYEIGPVGFNKFFFSDSKKNTIQFASLDFFRPAFNIGLKVNF